MVRSACSPARTGQVHLLTKIARSQSWRRPATSSPCGRCFTTAAVRLPRTRRCTAASSTSNTPAAGSCRTDTSGDILLHQPEALVSCQHLADEFLPASRLGMIDDFFRGPFFDNLSIGEEKHPVGASAGEEDFV